MELSALGEYGIDYKKGFARCMSSEEFYRHFLAMFLEDDTFQRAKAAFEKKNHKALFECAHELKGVCGNAALDDLYNAVFPLVEMLRSGDAEEEAVSRSFTEIETAYRRACEGIRLVLSES